ncbi:hypothetical protein MBLNU459_g1595t1 [Dothideomycetes sp. NU459]
MASSAEDSGDEAYDMCAEAAPATKTTNELPRSYPKDDQDELDAHGTATDHKMDSSPLLPDLSDNQDLQGSDEWMTGVPAPTDPATRPLTDRIANPLIYMPFDYIQTLRNRIAAHRLEPSGALDVHHYPPLFLYDMLQFPDAIGRLLDPSSTGTPIAGRMTPGVLRGHRALVMRGTGEPLLRATGAEADVVKGMVVFGRGRNNRRALSEHYGEGFRRVRGEVQITLDDGRKRDVWAYVWIWAGDEDTDLCVGGEAATWSLEKYAAGEFQ